MKEVSILKLRILKIWIGVTRKHREDLRSYCRMHGRGFTIKMRFHSSRPVMKHKKQENNKNNSMKTKISQQILILHLFDECCYSSIFTLLPSYSNCSQMCFICSSTIYIIVQDICNKHKRIYFNCIRHNIPPQINVYKSIKIKYYLSELLMPKLNTNHISAKEDENSIINQHEKKHLGKKTKKKYIFPEQMLYLTYISEFNNNLSQNKLNWESMKKQDILSIYANLSQKGYNKFEFLQFYIRVRKKSKIIQRYSDSIFNLNQEKIPFYRIYKTVQQFRQKKNGETYFLVQKQQKISNILNARKRYESNGILKIHILSNLDGIVLLSRPSFQVISTQKN